jgi:DNA repair protein RecO (recombination protein O)
MLEKTNGIVLRIIPFTNTSQIVTLLSESGNKMSFICKEACRPKSIFRGQYDFFYTCEFVYQYKPTRNLFFAKEVYPFELRPFFRTNWRASHCASWLCALVNATSVEGVSGLYRLLSESLDLLNSPSYPDAAILARFELRLLQQLGLLPNFGLPCGCELKEDMQYRFHIADGGVLCPEHDKGSIRLNEPSVVINKAVVDLATELVNGNFSAMHTKDSMRRLLRLLGLFINYHIDGLPIAGRDTCISGLVL